MFRNFLVSALTLASLLSASPAYAAGAAGVDDDANYDRLDGMGASGKKVQVIEWEGNLEIHVYPVGSLKGLALKLDKRDKNRPVMVIGYRFDTDAQAQLIRRAVLGIDLKEGFHAYRDKSADDYDKIIISNNAQSDQVVAFKLDAEPTQLYPDGHPLNKKPEQRSVASTPKTDASGKKSKKPAESDESDEKNSDDDSAGQIKPFFQ